MEKISECINKFEKSNKDIIPESLRKDDENEKKFTRSLKKEQETENFTPVKVTENNLEGELRNSNNTPNTDYRRKILKVKTKESGSFENVPKEPQLKNSNSETNNNEPKVQKETKITNVVPNEEPIQRKNSFGSKDGEPIQRKNSFGSKDGEMKNLVTIDPDPEVTETQRLIDDTKENSCCDNCTIL